MADVKSSNISNLSPEVMRIFNIPWERKKQESEKIKQEVKKPAEK
ncbi:MAG: hypothetical protein ACOX2Q_00075 [Dehalobacterium sp.]|jgi:hypothetical protein